MTKDSSQKKVLQQTKIKKIVYNTQSHHVIISQDCVIDRRQARGLSIYACNYLSNYEKLEAYCPDTKA